MLKICLLTAFIGHLLCWYCDCLIAYTPDGRFSAKMLEDNTKLSELMKRMPLKRNVIKLRKSSKGIRSMIERRKQTPDRIYQNMLASFNHTPTLFITFSLA